MRGVRKRPVNSLDEDERRTGKRKRIFQKRNLKVYTSQLRCIGHNESRKAGLARNGMAVDV